jgi:hypothetical protein
MDRDTDRKLAAAQEQLGGAFNAAIAEMESIPVGPERSRLLRGLATFLVAQPEEFRAAVVSQCPELAAAEAFPDTLLDPAEHELVSQLTQSDLDAIDEALLHSSASSWRKVHRVVGEAIASLGGRLPGLPLGLFVQRIGSLVRSGRLQAEGNLNFMRLSQVRLPPTDGSVA